MKNEDLKYRRKMIKGRLGKPWRKTVFWMSKTGVEHGLKCHNMIIMEINRHPLVQNQEEHVCGPSGINYPSATPDKMRRLFGNVYNDFIEIVSVKAPGNYSASVWSNKMPVLLLETKT